MLTQSQTIKSLLSLVLDYLRWTQLLPMIMVWSVSLALLVALVFVNFQTQTVSTSEYLLHGLEHLPFVGEKIARMAASTGDQQITTSDFKSFTLWAWNIVSLVFMLLSMLYSSLFKPSQPWSLKRKLFWLGFASFLLLAGYLFNYYIRPQNFTGSVGGWWLNFSAISLLSFSVGAYSLTISHFILFLSKRFLTEIENNTLTKTS